MLHAVARLLFAAPGLLVVLWASYAVGAGYAGFALPAPINALVTLAVIAVVSTALWSWVREPLRH